MAQLNQASRIRKTYGIMIVDDSQADFDLYHYFLNQDSIYHYDVFHSETAAIALDQLATWKPDIILVDYFLPDMDGLKLIAHIQSLYSSHDVKIIMMTGQGTERLAIEAMKKNIDDYLIKSDLNFNKFINAIYAAIASIQRFNNNNQNNRILIIEDSDADLEFYRRLIEKNLETSFDIYEANTGKEALELLDHYRFDVVLLDYNLPDTDGLTLIKHPKIKNHLHETCFLMMTGVGSEELVIKAMRNGFSDYIIKGDITPVVFNGLIMSNLYQLRINSQLRQLQYQKKILSRISLNIRQTLDLDQVLASALHEISKFINCDRTLIYPLGDNRREIIAPIADQSFASSLNLKIAKTILQKVKGNLSLEDAHHTFVIDDVALDPIDHRHQRLLEGLGIKSCISIPIIIEHNQQDGIWGYLILSYSNHAHHWTTEEITFLNEAALHLAIAVQQSLLVKDLELERDKAKVATRAKSNFLANMSHEIRTPMMGILGVAELMGLGQLSPEMMDYVNTIKTSSQNLLKIINDILDLSKLEANKIELQREVFCLEELLQELSSLFAAILQEKNLAFTLDIRVDSNQNYYGDCFRIKQVLTNLIGNAIKFTHHGGIEVIVAPRKQSEGGMEAEDGQMVLFQVKDTGIGIAEEAKKDLFKAFTQADNSIVRAYQGTGLGLSICKKLVHLMGGNLGMESEVNGGSTFWFDVPLGIVIQEQLEVKTSIVAGNASRNPLGRKHLVLLVEDNIVNQKVIQKQLNVINCDCDIVKNGAEAVEKVNAHGYDLVLMDCQMPVMDGYTATREIKDNENTAQTIIIGLTANAMKGDRDKCTAAGMDDYLKKPCTIDELQTMLAKWL